MDRTTASIISALKAEQQESLEAIVSFPKAESFDHGSQVGFVWGLRRALEVVESVLNDDEVSDDQL